MATVTVYNMKADKVGEIELADGVFGVEINDHLVKLAVQAQLANKRQGTQKAKTRAEVSGGGRKPWKQKGTGHARQGSTRSPQCTGGGMVFAPVPRDYTITLNKKEKRAALQSVLTDKTQDHKLLVLDELKLDEIKTKKFVEVMDNFKIKSALVVLDEKDDTVIRSAANVSGIQTALTNTINVYDILKYDVLVMTKAAAKKIEEVYA